MDKQLLSQRHMVCTKCPVSFVCCFLALIIHWFSHYSLVSYVGKKQFP